MSVFLTLFKSSLGRRIRDGFAIGYNVVFPLVLIILLGFLTKNNYTEIINSFQYYTLVTIPFCTLFGIITSAYGGKEDAAFGTAVRLIQAPINRWHIILSKLLADTVVFSLCNALVLTVCYFIFRLPLSGRFTAVILLYTAETFLACGFGLLLGLGIKNFIVVKNLINLPICIFAVLGGSFFPIGSLKPFWQTLLYLSPLTWMNRSIFRYLYDGEVYRNQLYRLSFVFFAAGFVICLVAVIHFKKEEFLNGNIPGYKK